MILVYDVIGFILTNYYVTVTQKPKKPFINYQETKVTELANGLRVATEDMGLRTNTIGLWIDCGTRYERLHEMGTAHFFEHLVFKVGDNKVR